MGGEMAIREGGAADAEAIRALTHEAYTPWIPVIGRLPTPMRADYGEAIRLHRFDLLHADGTLAALIETARQADHLLIVNVAVRPAFQGRGFGARLLGRAEAIAAEAGLPVLRLYTNKHYAGPLRLYASHGYRIEREAPYAGADRTRDDDIIVYMAKDRAPR